MSYNFFNRRAFFGMSGLLYQIGSGHAGSCALPTQNPLRIIFELPPVEVGYTPLETRRRICLSSRVSYLLYPTLVVEIRVKNRGAVLEAVLLAPACSPRRRVMRGLTNQPAYLESREKEA
jgi:hypothetical protein